MPHARASQVGQVYSREIIEYARCESSETTALCEGDPRGCFHNLSRNAEIQTALHTLVGNPGATSARRATHSVLIDRVQLANTCRSNRPEPIGRLFIDHLTVNATRSHEHLQSSSCEKARST